MGNGADGDCRRARKKLLSNNGCAARRRILVVRNSTRFGSASGTDASGEVVPAENAVATIDDEGVARDLAMIRAVTRVAP